MWGATDVSNVRSGAGSARDEPLDSTAAGREDLLDAAIDYARRGIPVFPCHTVDARGECSCGRHPCKDAGKHPRTHDGLKSATTDEATIREWWKTKASNIGAVPGPRFAVLDKDPWKDGEQERFAALGDLPSTLTVASGAHDVDGETIRGEHRWFEVPEGVRMPSKVGGVDVRSSGQYVLMPPSRHKSGVRYEIVGGSLNAVARVPSALVDGAPAPGAKLLAAPDAGRLTGVPIGRRTARALEGGFLPAPTDGETHREVAVGIARNLREAGTPRALVDWMMATLLDDPRASLDDARPWTTADAKRVVASVFAGAAPDQGEHLPRSKSRLRLMSLAEAFVIAQEEVDWVVPELLAAGEKAIVAGPPKSMKTWLVLHLMWCIACGEAVLGEDAWKVPTAQPVLIVQEEGSPQRWALRLATVFENVPTAPLYYVHRAGFSLINEKDVDWLIEQSLLTKSRLVVIDPWQRVTPGVKENDAADTGPAWDAIHRIARETNAAVVVLHHAGKGEGPPSMDMIRGSSRMAGEVDLILVMKKKERGTLEVFLDGRDLVRDDDGGNLEVAYEGDRPHLMRSNGFKVTLKPEKRRTRDAVIEAMRGANAPLSTAQVVTAVNEALPKGRSRQSVDRDLHLLADEGAVEKIASTRGSSTLWRWLGDGGANA